VRTRQDIVCLIAASMLKQLITTMQRAATCRSYAHVAIVAADLDRCSRHMALAVRSWIRIAEGRARARSPLRGSASELRCIMPVALLAIAKVVLELSR